jgi:hypothetical protein
MHDCITHIKEYTNLNQIRLIILQKKFQKTFEEYRTYIIRKMFVKASFFDSVKRLMLSEMKAGVRIHDISHYDHKQKKSSGSSFVGPVVPLDVPKDHE